MGAPGLAFETGETMDRYRSAPCSRNSFASSRKLLLALDRSFLQPAFPLVYCGFPVPADTAALGFPVPLPGLAGSASSSESSSQL